MKIDQQAYQRTCTIAKAAGMVPLQNPTEEQLLILGKIVEDCEAAYEPLPGDATLLGWYLFQQREQKEDQCNSDGVCSINDDLIAVIGLSVEMLERSDSELTYPKIVAKAITMPLMLKR